MGWRLVSGGLVDKTPQKTTPKKKRGKVKDLGFCWDCVEGFFSLLDMDLGWFSKIVGWIGFENFLA